MYKEYHPNILLAPYIETYWVSNDSIQGEETIRILPDGCVDILFNWDAKSFVPNIIGTQTTYLDVIYQHRIRMMGIRFRPCGITAFTRVPIHEFTNTKINISLFDTIFDHWFFENLLEKEDEIEKLEYIDSYFITLLKNIFTVDKQIAHTTNLIIETKGTQPISEILNSVCLCQRQFERKFKTAVGITPKAFSSIIRLQNTRRIISNSSNESLFSIALACGYYDHAHLIREHQRLAGDLPIR